MWPIKILYRLSWKVNYQNKWGRKPIRNQPTQNHLKGDSDGGGSIKLHTWCVTIIQLSRLRPTTCFHVTLSFLVFFLANMENLWLDWSARFTVFVFHNTFLWGTHLIDNLNTALLVVIYKHLPYSWLMLDLWQHCYVVVWCWLKFGLSLHIFRLFLTVRWWFVTWQLVGKHGGRAMMQNKDLIRHQVSCE